MGTSKQKQKNSEKASPKDARGALSDDDLEKVAGGADPVPQPTGHVQFNEFSIKKTVDKGSPSF
jgi:hypothetical protein